jgi:hypothetical protein
MLPFLPHLPHDRDAARVAADHRRKAVVTPEAGKGIRRAPVTTGQAVRPGRLPWR